MWTQHIFDDMLAKMTSQGVCIKKTDAYQCKVSAKDNAPLCITFCIVKTGFFSKKTNSLWCHKLQP